MIYHTLPTLAQLPCSSIKILGKTFVATFRNGTTCRHQISSPAITSHPQFQKKFVYLKYLLHHEDLNYDGVLDSGEDAEQLERDAKSLAYLLKSGMACYWIATEKRRYKISFFTNLFPMSKTDVERLGWDYY